ncbi:MAG: DinB family protein [Lewinellaceae bacterium]|nr:DinB family protein [Bacteroidota bacterium]MCB9325620.1 DinB family protein [Lewinellaceae bacterium]
MNWAQEIDKITLVAEMLFSGLSSEQLNWKPNSETWSIAQNLEHLIVVNETYYPVLSSLKKGTYKKPFLANFGFIVSFFGKTVLNAVKPDRKKKMKTFSIWEPGQSRVGIDIISRFKKHQSELQKQINEAKELLTNRIVISSPASKIVVYRLEIAFDIVVNHEQRHLEQAKEILRELKK